jgi:hypothetical protein
MRASAVPLAAVANPQPPKQMKSKEQAAHTPLPWHRNIKANGRYPVIFSGRNTHVCVASQMPTGEETEANIDFIIQACNSHPANLARIESLEQAAQKTSAELGGYALREQLHEVRIASLEAALSALYELGRESGADTEGDDDAILAMANAKSALNPAK